MRRTYALPGPARRVAAPWNRGSTPAASAPGIDVLATIERGFSQSARRELLATVDKWRKRRDDTRDELRPTKKIARLARDGRTNPEIGGGGCTQPRTV